MFLEVSGTFSYISGKVFGTFLELLGAFGGGQLGKICWNKLNYLFFEKTPMFSENFEVLGLGLGFKFIVFE